MQTNAERHVAAGLGGCLAHGCDLFGDLCRRLAPGQVLVDEADGEVDGRIRRPTEIDRRLRSLHRRQDQLGIMGLNILAIEMGMAGFDQVVEDLEEFGA